MATEQIDRIVQVYINNATSRAAKPLPPDELALITQILRVGDKLHYHLNVVMPSPNWW